MRMLNTINDAIGIKAAGSGLAVAGGIVALIGKLFMRIRDFVSRPSLWPDPTGIGG